MSTTKKIRDLIDDVSRKILALRQAEWEHDTLLAKIRQESIESDLGRIWRHLNEIDETEDAH